MAKTTATATPTVKSLTPTAQNTADIATLQDQGNQILEVVKNLAAGLAPAEPEPTTKPATLAIGGVAPTQVKINRQVAAIRKQLDPNRPALPTLGPGTVPRTTTARKSSTSPYVVADLPDGASFGNKGLRDQHYATGPDKIVVCEFPDGSTISRIQCFTTADPNDPVAPMDTYFQLEFHAIGSRGRDARIGGGAADMILWLVEQVTGQSLTDEASAE